MSSGQAQNSITMKPIDQRQRTRDSKDIFTIRLKNRESQRRFRARKRLEAELKSSRTIRLSTSLDAQVQLTGTVSNYAPRVLCKRKWKKDARRAHVSRDPEATANANTTPTLMSTSESQTVFHLGTAVEPKLEGETYSGVSLDLSSSEMNRLKVARRDWKADARNKKN